MDKSEIIEISKRVSITLMNKGTITTSDMLTAAAAFGLKDIIDGRPVVIDEDTAEFLSELMDEAGVDSKATDSNSASIIEWDKTYGVLKIRFNRPVKIRCMKPNDGIIFRIMPGVDGVDVPVDVMMIGLDDEFHIDDLYAEASENPGIVMAVDDPSVDAGSARVELQDYKLFNQQDLGGFLSGLKISALTDRDGRPVCDELRNLSREDLDHSSIDDSPAIGG